jgi:hypothetical protein
VGGQTLPQQVATLKPPFRLHTIVVDSEFTRSECRSWLEKFRLTRHAWTGIELLHELRNRSVERLDPLSHDLVRFLLRPHPHALPSAQGW